jgi:hypothetical protein
MSNWKQILSHIEGVDRPVEIDDEVVVLNHKEHLQGRSPIGYVTEIIKDPNGGRTLYKVMMSRNKMQGPRVGLLFLNLYEDEFYLTNE